MTQRRADEFISRSVIEDIKAEIEQQLFKNSQIKTNQDAKDMSIYNNALLDALKIIDKHCNKENTDENNN